MPSFYRAVALDFDGTLTESGRVSEQLLAVLDRVRGSGRLVVLVTGRIMSELMESDPEIAQHVDGVVAENGGVFWRKGVSVRLGEKRNERLLEAIKQKGVTIRAGEVLLACAAKSEGIVLREVRRLGLDYQMVRNREELMILPSGVSKATGLEHALQAMGVSRHNSIGIGDAENDHTLLMECELRVAVGNAVPALKERADIVLTKPNGIGVGEFLTKQFFVQRQETPSPREVMLAVDERGEEFGVSGAHSNFLITGGTGAGKSFAVGALAEALVKETYSVLVVDYKGDHEHLGELEGVMVVGGDNPMEPEEVVKLLGRRYMSVVLDLSHLKPSRVTAYLGKLQVAIDNGRAKSGLPHWIIMDEARGVAGKRARDEDFLVKPAMRGYCLVTDEPGRISKEIWNELDAVIALGPQKELADKAEKFLEIPGKKTTDAIAQIGEREIVMLLRGEVDQVRRGTLLERKTKHSRRWMDEVVLVNEQRFYFRSGDDEPVLAEAGGISEFVEKLETMSERVVRHHARGGDFSRWIGEVFGNEKVAKEVSELELRRHEFEGDQLGIVIGRVVAGSFLEVEQRRSRASH